MTQHKPTIETMINTAAIALTSMGTIWLTQSDGNLLRGILLIGIGMGLEFYKYWGRKKEYW